MYSAFGRYNIRRKNDKHQSLIHTIQPNTFTICFESFLGNNNMYIFGRNVSTIKKVIDFYDT